MRDTVFGAVDCITTVRYTLFPEQLKENLNLSVVFRVEISPQGHLSVVVPTLSQQHREQHLSSFLALEPSWAAEILYVQTNPLENPHSRGVSRNLGWQEARCAWVLFMDEDTRLSESACRYLSRVDWTTSRNGFSGFYRSNSKTSFWGAVYNSLCNLWLLAGQEKNRFLAGFFLIPKFSVPQNLQRQLFDETLVSGGEEEALIHNLEKTQADLRLSSSSDFFAWHESQHSWSSLVRQLRQHSVQKSYQRSRFRWEMISLLRHPSSWIAFFLIFCFRNRTLDVKS